MSERTCAATTSRSSTAVPAVRDIHSALTAAVAPQIRRSAPAWRSQAGTCQRATAGTYGGAAAAGTDPPGRGGRPRAGWRRGRLPPDGRELTAQASELVGHGGASRAAAEVLRHLTTRFGIEFLIEIGADQLSRAITLHCARLPSSGSGPSAALRVPAQGGTSR